MKIDECLEKGLRNVNTVVFSLLHKSVGMVN
jgi:hypothetical protein